MHLGLLFLATGRIGIPPPALPVPPKTPSQTSPNPSYPPPHRPPPDLSKPPPDLPKPHPRFPPDLPHISPRPPGPPPELRSTPPQTSPRSPQTARGPHPQSSPKPPPQTLPRPPRGFLKIPRGFSVDFSITKEKSKRKKSREILRKINGKFTDAPRPKFTELHRQFMGNSQKIHGKFTGDSGEDLRRGVREGLVVRSGSGLGRSGKSLGANHRLTAE